MIEISEKEARKLIVSGMAGYWSIHYKTIVIEHETQSVVRLRNKLFLLPISEFKISFVGEVGIIAGKLKGAFNIEISNEKLAKMAQEEMEERSKNLSEEIDKQKNAHKWN